MSEQKTYLTREEAIADAEEEEPVYTYVITAYRWGLRDDHSYVVAATTDLESAKDIARTEEEHRRGKYGVAVEHTAPKWRASGRFSRLVYYRGGTAGGARPEEQASRELRRSLEQ